MLVFRISAIQIHKFKITNKVNITYSNAKHITQILTLYSYMCEFAVPNKMLRIYIEIHIFLFLRKVVGFKGQRKHVVVKNYSQSIDLQSYMTFKPSCSLITFFSSCKKKEIYIFVRQNLLNELLNLVLEYKIF